MKQGIYDINGNVKEDRIPLVVEAVTNMIYTEQGLDELCQESMSIEKSGSLISLKFRKN
ncbi:hypothetical protein OWR28_02385 [Chryseobacterium sp. 1B4]